MILGATRTSGYVRPAGANPNYQPKLPNTGFYTHFHPFTQVTHAMRSADGFYSPPLNSRMGPTGLPAVPGPAPAIPTAPGVTAPVPAAGGTAGFGASGFGSTGGTHHAGGRYYDPYLIMRQGVIPGVAPSASNLRMGVTGAGGRIQGMLPFQQVTRSIDMPPPPPPVVVAPTPAATHGFGFPMRHTARPARRGGSWWSHLALNPPPVQESSCETIGPRRDGLYVTICNGRVTGYRDAAGNESHPYA